MYEARKTADLCLERIFADIYKHGEVFLTDTCLIRENLYLQVIHVALCFFYQATCDRAKHGVIRRKIRKQKLTCQHRNEVVQSLRHS